MNSDIKDGAKQIVKGLKAEARDFTTKVANKLDEDKDGKIEFADLKKQIVGEAKEGIDKLKALAADENLSQNAKDEINKAISKIKPMVDAAKMNAEIKKEKIVAEIEHSKKVDEIKNEVFEEAAALAADEDAESDNEE